VPSAVKEKADSNANTAASVADLRNSTFNAIFECPFQAIEASARR
jgi:hypothetical protein